MYITRENVSNLYTKVYNYEAHLGNEFERRVKIF